MAIIENPMRRDTQSPGAHDASQANVSWPYLGLPQCLHNRLLSGVVMVTQSPIALPPFVRPIELLLL